MILTESGKSPALIAKSNKQEWRTDIDWKKERIMVNQKYLDKAEVLIEALPYIQRFNRKIVVVKYGGRVFGRKPRSRKRPLRRDGQSIERD